MIVLALALALASPSSAAKRVEVWFENAIDHFDMSSTATFKQRCLVDASALIAVERHRGAPDEPPLFFYTGNEGPIEEFAASAGLLDELAPRFGALVAFCEHRCAGRTSPDAHRVAAPCGRPDTHCCFLFELRPLLTPLRYYGKSLPYGPGPSGSFSRANVGKLSVEQALADYALVRCRCRRGCGHPLRPWASSAPVRALDSIPSLA